MPIYALHFILSAEGNRILDSIGITNIRGDSVNDQIMKSENSAKLTLEGEENLPITFTAQLNSEGQLYVKVFGL